jgi:hypothetical protein
MDIETRKYLTEKVLGECWHDEDEYIPPYECQDFHGGKMPFLGDPRCHHFQCKPPDNCAFTTRDDMMDLYQAIEKAGKWDDFDNYSWNYRKGVKPEISHTTWLFCLSGEGYEDRCKMVAEFWGENESTPSR